MTFFQWLLDQQMRLDGIGQLAKQSILDKEKPLGHTSREQWLKHLRSSNATTQMIASLELAWNEYEQLKAAPR